MLGLGTDGDDGLAVAVRGGAIGEDLLVLKRGDHEALAGLLVLHGVVGGLAQPRPEGEQHLAILVLLVHRVIVLGGGLGIHDAGAVSLVEEAEHALVDAALLGDGLVVRAVGLGQHEAQLVIAVVAGRLLGIVHHVAIPVLEERHGVDVIGAFGLAGLVLHVLEHGDQVLEGIDLRIAHGLVVVPAQIRAEGRLQAFACLGWGLEGDGVRQAVDALVHAEHLVQGIGGVLEAIDVVLALEVRGHVHDQVGLDQAFALAVAGADDHQVAQIARSGAGIEQGATAAGHVRGHDVQLNVELVLDDLGEPALLGALVVGQLIEDVDHVERTVILGGRGLVAAAAAGRQTHRRGQRHCRRRDELLLEGHDVLPFLWLFPIGNRYGVWISP